MDGGYEVSSNRLHQLADINYAGVRIRAGDGILQINLLSAGASWIGEQRGRKTRRYASKDRIVSKLCHSCWPTRLLTDIVAYSQEPTHLTMRRLGQRQGQALGKGLW